MSTSRLFIGGLPISNTLDKKDLLRVVNQYAKDIEIIRDAEGYCKGFAYINVPHNAAQACISDLAGKPFLKGLLRVEPATEPFMDKLRREWGEAALSGQYNTPSTSTPFSSFTPVVLDTSSFAGAAKAKKIENKENGNAADSPASPPTDKPLSAKQKRELKQKEMREKGQAKTKARLEKKAAAKAAAKEEAKEARENGESTNESPKRKAEELELEAPVPAEVAPKKVAAPKKAAAPKQMSLFMGDDDESNPVMETEPAEEPEVEAPAKKAKTENNKKDNQNKNNNTNNNTNNNNTQNSPPLPSSPVTNYNPSSPPVTPGNNTINGWDLDKVYSWATQVAGDELAEKLKSKGVKGRKLANWRDTYQGNANGLRKQITEFLQIPESLEADADDLSDAILRLA